MDLTDVGSEEPLSKKQRIDIVTVESGGNEDGEANEDDDVQEIVRDTHDTLSGRCCTTQYSFLSLSLSRRDCRMSSVELHMHRL
jgi:hypothetical protein